MATVLVIGGGGREHALAWKLAQSAEVGSVLVAKGNGGTARAANVKIQNLTINISSASTVVEACKQHNVALVVVGPEDPLANGLADTLREANIPVFGPNKSAAEIEASKAFSKEFMARHSIPTAAFRNFTDYEEAVAYVRSVGHSVVIKASGLAAGKGVVLPQTVEEAEQTLKSIMIDKEFGVAGAEVVVEQLLVGEEVSCLAFTDGVSVAMLPPAQDHKRAFDHDQGPNTGGMGVYAPAPIGTPRVLEEVRARVLQPAVDGLRAEGRPFVGLLYAGIMVCQDGIYTLEFNCRFGDPETQVVLPLLASDLFRVCLACAQGRLAEQLPLQIHPGATVTVVAASGGYPGKYPTGLPISGVAAAEAVDPRITVFHAGTALSSPADASSEAQLLTSGGRVLAVTAVGASFVEARQLAYAGLSRISFDGMHYRTDIGFRALKRLEEQQKQQAEQKALRVAVLGSTRGSSLQPVLDALRAGRLSPEGVHVALVLSNKTDAPILQRARDHGIEARHFDGKGRAREEVDAEVSAILKQNQIDLVLLIGYMRILSVGFVRDWANRILNVHPSLLPAFAGGMDLQVHEAVLKAGVPESGCTVHIVDEGVDSGPIVVQKRCAVLPDDTAESLKARVQALEGEAFIAAIHLFAQHGTQCAQHAILQ